MDLNSHFTTYILQTFTKSSWVRNNYEDVYGLVVHVLACIRVSAVVLVTKLILQLSLKSVKDPFWVIAPMGGQFWYVVVPAQVTVGLNKQSGPYVWGCWQHCIWWRCYDDYPSVDTGPCVRVSCKLWWLVSHWDLQKLMCPRWGGSLLFGVHCCELYMGVGGIKVDEELLDVFCLVDSIGVFHISRILEGLGRCLLLWLYSLPWAGWLPQGSWENP